MIQSELSLYGAFVKTVPDNTEGLRDLTLGVTSGAPFELLLLDYHIASLDVPLFISGIKEDPSLTKTCIILMTAPCDNNNIQKIEAIPGVYATLPKPVKREKLLSIVSQATGFAKSQKPGKQARHRGSIPGFPSRTKTKKNSLPYRNFTQTLLVVTNPEMRSYFMQKLAQLNSFCNSVNDSQSALREYQRKPYHLMIIDISGGPAALDLVKQVRSQVTRFQTVLHITAITTSVSEEDKEKCIQAKIDDYLAWPLEENALENVLEEISTTASTTASTPFGRVPTIWKRSATGVSPEIVAEPPSPRNLDVRKLQMNSTMVQPYYAPLKALASFVPQEFQEIVAPNRSIDKVQLGDAELRCISIMFSDIRDFTSTTEKMFVKEVMKFINTYLAFAIPAIAHYRGFIDKFIGDAIMAIFAHPNVQEQALSAVKAAVKMQKDLDFMCNMCGCQAETGIGINTGKAIMGFIGTESRMSPTVLGDAVNLASRTESLCKTYGARILITEQTLLNLGDSSDEFSIRLVDHVTVKGKSTSCKIYEVMNGDKEDVRILKERFLPQYNQAMELFAKGDFENAALTFQKCTDIYSKDKPSLLYLERCKELISSPQRSTWDGVYHYDHK